MADTGHWPPHMMGTTQYHFQSWPTQVTNMLSTPLCLGTGTVLVMAGGGTAGYLTYLQLRNGASGHALLSTSDTLAVLVTGILFLANTFNETNLQDSPRALGQCNYTRVVTVAALFLAPFINAFTSILAQTYECYGNTCTPSKANASQRRIGMGLLAQWAVPAVATLALLFSDIHVRRPVSRDAECFSSSAAILPTEVQYNCTEQQSDSVYALMSNVELPLKNNDDLIRKHIEENKNTSVIKTELTNSIVNNIYKIVQESLNSSKQFEDGNNYFPQFLHRHRRQTSVEENHNEYRNDTEEENASISDYENNTPDYENIAYPTDGGQIQSNTQDSVAAADKQEANTGSSPHTSHKPINNSTPTRNFTYILLPDHIDTIPSFNDVTTCVTQCYLTGQFLKTHLFIVLFLCYFLPISVTGILYFLIRKSLADQSKSDALSTQDKQGTREDADHIKSDGKHESEANSCSTRLVATANMLKQFIVMSVVLWTPSLVETLLRVWFCISVPNTVSTLLFELAQLHGLARIMLNIRLTRADLKGGNTLCKGVLQQVTIHPTNSEETTSPSSSEQSLFTHVKQALTRNNKS